METSENTSAQLFRRACSVIPGGVNSPVRAFAAVEGEPVFIRSARGSRIHDVDGREYIDYVCSWGPAILGHAHPEVVEAVQKAAERGLTFGAPTEAEVVLAEMIVDSFESIESVRLVNSGTEATMSAIRLARAFTGRDVVLKMEGCYHGHVDCLLVKTGSGALTLSIPGTPGVPESTVSKTVSVPFNDVTLIQELVESRGDEIACLIVEPVPANMGLVLPQEGYLELLRELTDEYGILLIFDEVVSGFRLGRGGAQGLFGVRPDLTCLGKIVGGGLPVGAYGGRREIMDYVAPCGPVYQAGTLSGNPLATAAGIATLSVLGRDGVYGQIEARARELVRGMSEAAKEAGVAIEINAIGSCLSVFFTDRPVVDHDTAKRSDTQRYARFFHRMLERGIYLAPSQFETLFVSLAHTESDIQQTIDAARDAFKKLNG